MFWYHVICARPSCTIWRSGQADAKARMYLRLRGERPRMSGKAIRRSVDSRSITFAPQPSRCCRSRITRPMSQSIKYEMNNQGIIVFQKYLKREKEERKSRIFNFGLIKKGAIQWITPFLPFRTLTPVNDRHPLPSTKSLRPTRRTTRRSCPRPFRRRETGEDLLGRLSTTIGALQ